MVTDYTFSDLLQETAAAESVGARLSGHQCQDTGEVARAVKGADMVLVQFAPLDATAIAGLAEGAAVVRYGIGYDNIDLKACAARGISVGYVPDYCAGEVADHAASMVLAMHRKLPQLDASVRRDEWKSVEIARPILASEDVTVGFFGFGNIARKLRDRLAPFGFSFAVSDPTLDAAQAQADGVTLMSADALFAHCDVISLHAPATPATNGVVNAERLRTMKPHAVIVNTSRGSLIDEAALAEALHAGTIGGAALDVFEKEPLPPASPLRNAPNLLLTPHSAWYSEAAIGLLQKLAGDDIVNHLSGRPLRKPVPTLAGA
ncbi:C-terminal binding protein [Pseudooceanicola aestuarii]|uniref:C-terminal binding protein n=1 Tax=Pseudooceanicola aestuarii TaxID=2697319 RepID=UPI0013D4368D|nr:C-terminal binding protein [Pseudooceanicola aestuarii]